MNAIKRARFTRSPGQPTGGALLVAGRVQGALVTLALLPLAASRADQRELGVLLLLAGSAPLIGLFDLGIANALVTPVAAAAQHNDLDEVAALVSAARRRLRRAALAVGVIGGGLVTCWTVLNAPLDGPERSTSTLCFVATVSLALSVPSGIPGRVLLALGNARDAGVSALVGNAIVLAAALTAWALGAGSWAFLAAMLAPNIAAGTVAGLILRRRHPMASHRESGSARQSRDRRSLLYLGIGICGLIAFETDGFVLAAVIGTDEVSRFLVPVRVFLVIPALTVVYLSPLWPAAADLVALGDHRRVDLLLRRTLVRVGVGGLAITAAVAAAIGPVMRIATPEVEPPNGSLLIVLAALSLVHVASAPYAVFLAGLDLLRPQLASATAMALGNIALSIVLALRLGLIGPAVATIFCQVGITLIPMHFVVTNHLRSMSRPLS